MVMDIILAKTIITPPILNTKHLPHNLNPDWLYTFKFNLCISSAIKNEDTKFVIMIIIKPCEIPIILY